MDRVLWIATYILVLLPTLTDAATLKAVCTMTGVSAVSTEKVSGTVTFTQKDASDTVTVNLDLSGFDKTDSRVQHGFHIHQTGSTGSNCGDAGSHFNGVSPGTNTHGAPTATIRHVGDLGNVAESNGKVVATLTDKQISLKPSSNGYIIGRAVVVHQDLDDMGLGGHSDSETTGHAGKRVGCCVIVAGAQGVTFSIALMIMCLLGLSATRW